MNKQFCVYILTNGHNTVLYTGVTGTLAMRVGQHKAGGSGSFASRYKVTKLVYYEVCRSAESAITREKQIKGGSRKKKEQLIKSTNPTWRD